MTESPDVSPDVPPTPEAIRADLAFDERVGRPGPKPPRLDSRLDWLDLARIVVRTPTMPKGAGHEEMQQGDRQSEPERDLGA